MNKNWKYVLLLSSLLMVMPVEVPAMSDAARALYERQLALFETDSVEAFEDVTARLKQLLEKEGENEKLYDIWYNEAMYVITYVSSSLALATVGEMKDYAQKHDSKYGFYMATMSNALIAYDMGLKDRAEKLLRQNIDYKERHLPDMKPAIQLYVLFTDINNDKK